MIRVFLVEDEPPALRKLERLVSAEPDLSICGGAGTAREAIEGIQRTHPELVILDVRLPDGTGFDVLHAFGPASFETVFLTAYDRYAVDAFELAALDYLLKPVTQERFGRAIERARKRLGESAPKPRYVRRLIVERRKAVHILEVEAISWIASDRNYAVLYTNDGEFSLRTTMEALERQLDPEAFVRVSRSAIVRIGAIRNVCPRGDRNYAIVLLTGEEVQGSKRYWTHALERLS